MSHNKPTDADKGSAVRAQYRKEYDFYLRAVEESSFFRVPDRLVVKTAADNLGLETAFFVSTKAWLPTLEKPMFNHCIAHMSQAYLTWSGRNSISFVYTLIHELLHIVSVDQKGKARVKDCKHRSCVMNPSLDGIGPELHVSHLRNLDRDGDGVVSASDLDRNCDGSLRIGFVQTHHSPSQLGGALRLFKSELVELFPSVKRSNIFLQEFDEDEFFGEPK